MNRLVFVCKYFAHSNILIICCVFFFGLSFTETAKKIIIPESIAIKLANSSEVSAEFFFRDIYRRYQQYQRLERKERQRVSKKMRVHKAPSSEIAAIKEQKIIASIRSTISTIEDSSIARSTIVPMQYTTNSFIVQTKDQVAYVDDEDLENDLEASGLNRIRNETSIAYNFDDGNETDN